MSKIINVYTKEEWNEVIVDDDYNLPNKIFVVDEYAWININGKAEKLHRVIINAKEGEIYDHRNRNKLDNRKENLRLSDKSKNGANRVCKGISFKKNTGKWTAQMMVNYKYIHLGTFTDPEKAQQVYRKAHAEAFGEFSPYYEYYSGITKEEN
ncbi:HNH endonuclease [Bacillus thuringiensis]|uniref:HNH endonuclease n=1 Tax=Bacillus thuringiensis TaxID=1428 RepID=UPI00159C6799|nr:HNH endonuclease [Bacillus thuringiensis]